MHWHPSLMPPRRHRTWLVPLTVLLLGLALGFVTRTRSRDVAGYTMSADFAAPPLALPFVLPIMARN